MSADTWVVEIGGWAFGPFSWDDAREFASEHGASAWPLWRPDDIDALSNRPALVQALAAAAPDGQTEEQKDG